MVIRRSLASLLALLALWGCGPREGEVRVHRGAFVGRALLTGELRAVRSVEVIVPRLPMWRTQIGWMERDGTPAKKGQKVLELDLTSIAGDLEDKRLAADRALNDYDKQAALNASNLEASRFALEQRKVELDKARIDAAVPSEILARRDYEARQLALTKAEAAHQKAVNSLDTAQKAARADLSAAKLALEKARREQSKSEDALRSMTILAPCDGVLDVAQHEWEGRKLQIGDTVFVGWTLLRIPDLSQVEVDARLFDVDEGRVQPGMEAECRLDTFPDMAVEGRVKVVTPVAQEVAKSPTRRAFNVVVSLDKSDPGRMRSGMSVKVAVRTARRADVLLVPRTALDLSGEQPLARLAGGGTAKVTLGPCDAMECVLESGLKEDQRLMAWDEKK
jgi:multidrug resistance efflux pump